MHGHYLNNTQYILSTREMLAMITVIPLAGTPGTRSWGRVDQQTTLQAAAKVCSLLSKEPFLP